MRKHPLSRARKGLISTIVVLALFTVLTLIPSYFPSDAVTTGKGLIERTSTHVPGLENFDIRTDKTHESAQRIEAFRASAGRTASAIADTRDGFVRGEDALRTRVSSLKIEYTERLGIPEVITPDMWKSNIERLTGASGMKRADLLRNFARQNNELIGMEPGQIDELKVLADYENPNGYLGFAHLEQRI
ncbi:MAG TPA: hypothetical protein VK918_01540, partial [Pyrinomonadaceae bacterium]|nr:hypothetical protein [Pyrinomonadaceae bacterium]